MILGNFLVWLVPPARRALDLEAKAHPGTSFTETNRGLLRFALFVTPAALAGALAAALL
jgi:hypothetical protein